MPRLLRTLCLLLALAAAGAARADAPLAPPAVAPAQPTPAAPPIVVPAPPRFALTALPAPLAARLHLLERSLRELGAQDAARVWQGSLLLALGAGASVGAAFVDEPVGRALLGLTGATTLVQGTLRLTLSTHAARNAAQFLVMPEQELAQAERKLAFGASALAQAARGQRRARICDATLGMLAASSFIPLSWSLSRREDPDYRFGQQSGDYVGLSLSVIAFAASLVQALIASDAERDLARYRALPRD